MRIVACLCLKRAAELLELGNVRHDHMMVIAAIHAAVREQTPTAGVWDTERQAVLSQACEAFDEAYGDVVGYSRYLEGRCWREYNGDFSRCVSEAASALRKAAAVAASEMPSSEDRERGVAGLKRIISEALA